MARLSTARALVEPNRLAALLVMGVPLVLSQREAWAEPALWPVVLLAAGGLVLLATAAYRALLGDPGERGARSRRERVLRHAAFALLASAAPLALVGLPRLVGSETGLVGTGWTAAVAAGLFWVGGYGLGRDIELERAWRAASQRAEALRTQAELAELRALRARLDPHFLFNTLNAIAEWCREDPAVAERALLDLSALLRDLVDVARRPRWTLADERGLVERVLALHLLRDPGRFTVRVDAEPGLEDLEVPPLLCLPLVENAMTHGPGRGHRGEVRLELRRDDGHLLIALENPGPFLGTRPGGEGLAEVERRLATWRPGARLSIQDLGGRTRAEVRA